MIWQISWIRRFYEYLYTPSLTFYSACPFWGCIQRGRTGCGAVHRSGGYFFSALCCEAARQGEQDLQRLVVKSEKGDITFSDLLPWYKRKSVYEWYIPKPVLSVTSQKAKEENLQEAKVDSNFRKKAKKSFYTCI